MATNLPLHYRRLGGPGRKKGTLNRVTAQHMRFCRDLLGSADYRDGLRKRAINGSLHPAIETMLHHYAYSKPRETLDVTLNQNEAPNLRELTDEGLAEEARSISLEVLELKKLREEEETRRALEAVVQTQREAEQAVEEARQAQNEVDQVMGRSVTDRVM